MVTFVVNFTRQQFNGKCKQYSSVTISYYCSLLEYVNIGKIKGYIQIRYFHMICIPTNSNQWLTTVKGGSDLFAYIHDTDSFSDFYTLNFFLEIHDFKSYEQLLPTFSMD